MMGRLLPALICIIVIMGTTFGKSFRFGVNSTRTTPTTSSSTTKFMTSPTSATTTPTLATGSTPTSTMSYINNNKPKKRSPKLIKKKRETDIKVFKFVHHSTEEIPLSVYLFGPCNGYGCGDSTPTKKPKTPRPTKKPPVRPPARPLSPYNRQKASYQYQSRR